jgi:hypothetical protein
MPLLILRFIGRGLAGSAEEQEQGKEKDSGGEKQKLECALVHLQHRLEGEVRTSRKDLTRRERATEV